MNNEEYNKILQLVKSDCPNNRLLGFQLAKGLDYDLMELLNNTRFRTLRQGVLHRKEYVIGDYLFVIKCNENEHFEQSWYFGIDKLAYLQYCVKGVRLNNTYNYSKEFYQVYNKMSNEFINLIINE